MQKIINFLMDEEGATAIEYGLMVALIAVVIIAAVNILGRTTSNTFTNVGAHMSSANSGS